MHLEKIRFLLTVSITISFVKMGESIFYRGNDESYLSDVNLERFYLLEENAMSNADALIRKDIIGLDEEETEEEHKKHAMNMTKLQSVLDRTKELHREVGPDIWNFLGHPVNLLNLFNRLNNEWKKGLDALLKTTPCKLWKITAMKHYLEFLRDSTPDDEDLKTVVNHLMKLQNILGNPTRDVANGILGNTKSVEPLRVDQQFIIGKILYEEEDMPLAVSWFEVVADWLKEADSEKKAGINFNERQLYPMMATAYYLTGKLAKAVSITERLSDLDPGNARILHNLNFFQTKLHQQMDGDDSTKKKAETVGRKRTRMEKICAGLVFKPSKKRCVLQPVHGSVAWFVYKKEILRHKPSIAIYHDVITKFPMAQLQEYAHSKLINTAWLTSKSFIDPQMSINIDFPNLPKKKSIRYSVQKLGHAFDRLPGPNRKFLMGWGQMQVLNVGRSGINFQDYEKDLHLQQIGLKTSNGVMFAFLSEPNEGGDIVIGSRKVLTPAPKGSILVYHSTHTPLHSLCPALGGSHWVAVQPFYEKEPNICLKSEKLIPWWKRE